MPTAMRLQYPKIIATDLIDRLKDVYDVRTDKQLAERIGVKDVIFTRWRDRNTFHEEVVFAVAHDKGVSINYLLFGRPESTVSADLTEAEIGIVRDMCKEQGLTEPGLLRFAIRLYQEVCERFANGERIEFKGEAQSPVLFVLPMLKALRARHAPRKAKR